MGNSVFSLRSVSPATLVTAYYLWGFWQKKVLKTDIISNDVFDKKCRFPNKKKMSKHPL